LALLSPVLVVQVVEVARQAAVEGLVAAKSKQVVLADGETAGVDGASLRRSIELELEVGGDVTSAVLRVVDGVVRQRQDEHSVGSTLSALLDIKIPLGVSDLGNGDLEVSIEASRAAIRNSTFGGDLIRDTLSECSANEGESDSGGLHLVNADNDDETKEMQCD
ncbi:hypothetical protein C7G95_19175, partial [Acinetobacter nosocomialis]